jgi:hypothetical protein
MAPSKYTLYNYVELDDGSWRCQKAAVYSNGKIKPNTSHQVCEKASEASI